MTRRFYISTMGCQMNEYDSDRLSQILMDSGHLPTDNQNDADLILINSCTIRAKAQQKAYSQIGRMASLKAKRPAMILGLMGCIAQQEGSKLFKRFPALDIVLGTREISRIPEILERIERRLEKVTATDLSLRPIYPAVKKGYFYGRVKSYLSIMEGCNNFCSYCIVPYVRGREVSRSPQEIIEEAESLVSQGVREITLLGQNVNSYVSAGKEGLSFPGLLRMLDRIDGLERIRFTTSHPKDLSEDLISCFKELESLCPHIHLPFQSGSDRILELMNRGYSSERYLELVRRLREARPDIAISSDVIVGFPGETEDEFKMTLDLMEKIGFTNVFSFKYSDRKGTAAEKMRSKVSEDVKSLRLRILQQTQKDITLRINKGYEGRTEEVLVEGESKRGGQFTGRTGSNKVINFSSDNNILNKLVKVNIKTAFVNSLRGVEAGSIR